MKTKLILSTVGVLMLLPAEATVTMQNFFGAAYTSSGGLVANDTLWVLVVDTDNNNSILGTSLDSTLTSITGNSLFTAGQSINLGTTISGDTVFAMGGFNEAGGTGTDFSVLTLTLGTNGAVAGRDFSFVWFPGVTFAGTTPIVSGSSAHIIGSQVGAINRTTTDGVGTGFTTGMIIPAEGADETLGAATAVGGGTVTQPQFTAINLIPEPSSFLLTALGVFGFILRRRR